jgi:hypothetical protein
MGKNVVSTGILFANGDMGVKGMKIRLYIKDLIYYNNIMHFPYFQS